MAEFSQFIIGIVNVTENTTVTFRVNTESGDAPLDISSPSSLKGVLLIPWVAPDNVWLVSAPTIANGT